MQSSGDSEAAAEITTTIRKIPIEVPPGGRDGLPKPCVVNCDNLRTISRQHLTERIGQLQAVKVRDVKRALGYALGWEELIGS
jgi:mRNA interferase MazF